ncbi:MAG: DUF2934 domain-containing protein [Xanthobacteraceae bacterium]
MDSTLEDLIRQRAYFLWLDDSGSTDATYFWLIAEREVMAEVAAQSATARERAEVAAPANRRSGENQEARRVNALVQLSPDAPYEQTATGIATG